MSVDNSELLMLLGGKKKVKQTIGIAGQQGFGVGVYGGSPSDLKAMGLTPMNGCKDPTSNNYGNYIHTNRSVMVFIPAFAIRIGNVNAPLYSKYAADTIEIGDVELAGKDGWAIPRGFYDGGKLHSGFFIDKYLCSKDPTKKVAISTDLADPISLHVASEPSATMPNCDGALHDAITLSRARGEHYALVSCYQWAIISLVSLAHAQAATSEESCAWYDANGLTNYPKGNNTSTSSLYKDVEDKSVIFNTVSDSPYYSKAGAGVPVEKTTHNGQESGITDVNGNKWQPVLGWMRPTKNLSKTAKLSVKMHDFTKDNCTNDALFDTYSTFDFTSKGWNFWRPPALYTTDDAEFPLCGVTPKTLGPNPSNTEVFGKDGFYLNDSSASVLLVAGYYASGSYAGMFCREGDSRWTEYSDYYSFRAAGYPP